MEFIFSREMYVLVIVNVLLQVCVWYSEHRVI